MLTCSQVEGRRICTWCGPYGLTVSSGREERPCLLAYACLRSRNEVHRPRGWWWKAAGRSGSWPVSHNLGESEPNKTWVLLIVVQAWQRLCRVDSRLHEWEHPHGKPGHKYMPGPLANAKAKPHSEIQEGDGHAQQVQCRRLFCAGPWEKDGETCWPPGLAWLGLWKIRGTAF